MAKYFVDTEFIEDGRTIDLISIGIVAEDGRELYLQSVEFDANRASAWVNENVLPHLSLCPCCGDQVNHDHGKCRHKLCPWRTRKQMRDEIEAFCDPVQYGNPELIGWCAAYDLVAFCQLFGTMMDLPVGYPHYIRDIQHILDDRSMPDDELPLPGGVAHNALDDARYIRQLWDFLK